MLLQSGVLGFASRVEMRRSCDRREGFPLLSLHPRQTPEAGRLAEATGRGTAHALLGSLGLRFQAVAQMAGIHLPLLISIRCISCFPNRPGVPKHCVSFLCTSRLQPGQSSTFRGHPLPGAHPGSLSR